MIHNVRSCLNVGAMLRTAEGLGVAEVILTGYTPYPIKDSDERLPYLAAKISKRIAKTSLGAEQTVPWQHYEDIEPVIENLKNDGYSVAALELAENSVKLPDFNSPEKLAIIVGNEPAGLEEEVISLCDVTLEIPMFGQKESFNVASAAAMALYHCRFFML
jgi:tRNA G18 (ribose-2'-O)-methylase SpoU